MSYRQPDCQHEHIRFEDGYFNIVCIDCGGVWQAMTSKTGVADYSRRGSFADPFRATRHDRFVMPRTGPKEDNRPPPTRIPGSGRPRR
jgi:ribosomal protein S27E